MSSNNALSLLPEDEVRGIDPGESPGDVLDMRHGQRSFHFEWPEGDIPTVIRNESGVTVLLRDNPIDREFLETVRSSCFDNSAPQ